MKDFDEHRDELNETPFLRSLKKENIFQTPEDYFDTLPQVWEDSGENGEPEKSFLDQIEKKNIFQIPEGYFETFAAKIIPTAQKTPSGESSRGGIVRNLFSLNRYSVGIAAAVALLISLGIWISDRGNTPLNNNQRMLADISTEELINGVDLAEVDLNTILDIAGDEVISGLGETLSEDMSTEELDNLLEDMDVSDLEGILEELN
ncbi:MAG: hypothetical protein SF052_00885 [Bacteroidia bacterium]|nr:hypothetical protein [Bacteroidia bacterium]